MGKIDETEIRAHIVEAREILRYLQLVDGPGRFELEQLILDVEALLEERSSRGESPT